MSTSCPNCHRPVVVEDLVIKNYQGVTNVETCGKLTVTRRGNVVAKNRVVAFGGIEMLGRLQCGEALVAGQVVIGAKAEWKGDLHAMSILVRDGAKIGGGHFLTPDDPLAEHRYQEHEDQDDEKKKKKPATAPKPPGGNRSKRLTSRTRP